METVRDAGYTVKVAGGYLSLVLRLSHNSYPLGLGDELQEHYAGGVGDLGKL
jgi:hypothetical protein